MRTLHFSLWQFCDLWSFGNAVRFQPLSSSSIKPAQTASEHSSPQTIALPTPAVLSATQNKENRFYVISSTRVLLASQKKRLDETEREINNISHQSAVVNPTLLWIRMTIPRINYPPNLLLYRGTFFILRPFQSTYRRTNSAIFSVGIRFRAIFAVIDSMVC